jgi:hypothetical protein
MNFLELMIAEDVAAFLMLHFAILVSLASSFESAVELGHNTMD